MSQSLVSSVSDKNKLILKKVEPWNSVRVTFKIPREAAVRLKDLAQQGNSTLKELGVLAVQIQGQNISLTIAGKNNEHTQLVFRAADSAPPPTSKTASVMRTNTPALDGLSPQGPGPGQNLAEKQNIEDYLRQLLPAHIAEAQALKAKNNSFLPFHGFEPTKSSMSLSASVSGHTIHASSSSPSTNALSPSQSPGNGGPGGLKFPGLPHGLQPALKQALDSLPPPPPYPGDPGGHQNNIQKVRAGLQAPRTMLVDLLQQDPTLASLLSAGKLTPGLDPESLQPPKKKRKPRVPREKKNKKAEQTASAAASASMVPPSSGVPTATLSSPGTSRLANTDIGHLVNEFGLSNAPQALLHNTSVPRNVPFSSPVTHMRKSDEDTAGKIINPVTGVLEPVDLSDTSPAKSDGDKHSPRSLQGQRKSTLELQELIKTQRSLAGPQGMHANPLYNIQKAFREHSNPHSVPPGGLSHSTFVSSHSVSQDISGFNPHFQESIKNSVVKSTTKNDVLPLTVNRLGQMLPTSHGGNDVSSKSMCDNNSAESAGAKPVELHKKVHSAQEHDVNTIPIQLLNKPLLQVKQDSALQTGKPSGSPDSNGDSECSTHSITLDTQSCPDPSGATSLQSDNRSYNTDSGVGSCSERSDVSPSEIADTDFKTASSNVFDTCSKPVTSEAAKQHVNPPASKVMTVGYALEETQGKKLPVNHKVVSSVYGSEKDINSPSDLRRSKVEGKSDVCSSSQTLSQNMTPEEQQRQIMKNVKEILRKESQEALNRKSPKTHLQNSLPAKAEGNLNTMQGKMV